MTAAQLRQNRYLMERLEDLRQIETSAGVEEWFRFPRGFIVHVRKGRVATIFR